MNQTRVFLIFAWLMVAMLLWMEWGKERAAPPAAATPVAAATASAAAAAAIPAAVPGPATPAAAGDPAVPAATPAVSPAAIATAPVADAHRVTVRTDVLDLVLDGGSVLQADLPQFPQTRQGGGAPVRLFDADPANFYAAQAGWVSATGAAPSHQSGFVPEGAQTEFVLADGQQQVEVPFVWNGPDGVSIRRTYTLTRGSYAVEVRDEVVNRGTTPWQGQVYRQLIRKPPVIKRGYTHPESFSFTGTAWFDGKYQRRRFGEDYLEDGRVDQQAANGWIAMLQHHFFSAWIPEGQQPSTISLDAPPSGALVRELGQTLQVAPGATATTQARLYVGPKLVSEIRAQQVPGLERAVDYSQFSILAILGEGLFWVLSHLYALFGNWGWAIIGLVFLVKLALYPLSAAQYKSFAKMRKFQPRIQQLKERYGDDKQKFQTAMMELYKKEKINPMGGCLPILVQMPVFLALYWVLVESVELRHAPWIWWIQDLTARDPYFILPVINVAVMWFTQKLQPSPGMDPVQQKMMQFMPVAFGVMMAFFPAGLVLYWVTNGSLGLLQQWWMMKKHGEPAPKAAPAK
ncbi:MAG: membrane protein insertase YidC [Xanthomonadales bacterium]|nr:membrane protein insertase YidC [Xanthomonadaceae bacterium]MBN8223208.1 membrane protein insertase YidC [Xanthomonadales bacterium]MCA0197399.1 membrane protein insertase YidC [Pseudomonadota bacterium]